MSSGKFWEKFWDGVRELFGEGVGMCLEGDTVSTTKPSMTAAKHVRSNFNSRGVNTREI